MFENDFHQIIDRYQAVNQTIGLIDSINLDSNKRLSHPVASLSVNQFFDKIQRIGAMLLHRKEAFKSATTNSVFVQYYLGV